MVSELARLRVRIAKAVPEQRWNKDMALDGMESAIKAAAPN